MPKFLNCVSTRQIPYYNYCTQYKRTRHTHIQIIYLANWYIQSPLNTTASPTWQYTAKLLQAKLFEQVKSGHILSYIKMPWTGSLSAICFSLNCLVLSTFQHKWLIRLSVVFCLFVIWLKDIYYSFIVNSKKRIKVQLLNSWVFRFFWQVSSGKTSNNNVYIFLIRIYQ